MPTNVYVIAFGSVATGYNFIGPFNTEDLANEWGDLHLKNKLVYEVISLKNPAECLP